MIGFDIGGTKCAVSIGEDQDGVLVIKDKKVIPTELSISPYQMIDKMCDLAESMTDDFSKIGISCGGPLSSKEGTILSPPNLTGWDDIKIVQYLKDKYMGKVSLRNDADACALAEWNFGAGKGTQNMIFLTFGTGMGAGLILNGSLYTGTNDMAGEVGHIRMENYGPIGYGKMGSFEGFCSGNGIKQIGITVATELFQMGKTPSFCKDISLINDISAKTIAEFAEKGYKDALKVFEISAEKLGQGLSVLIDILNPEMIVIGSIYQRCENLFKDTVMKVIENETLIHSRNAVKIVPAELKENLGDYAALSVANL